MDVLSTVSTAIRLADDSSQANDDAPAHVANLHLLAGGSSQEAWSLDVVCDEGLYGGVRAERRHILDVAVCIGDLSLHEEGDDGHGSKHAPEDQQQRCEYASRGVGSRAARPAHLLRVALLVS